MFSTILDAAKVDKDTVREVCSEYGFEKYVWIDRSVILYTKIVLYYIYFSRLALGIIQYDGGVVMFSCATFF